MLAALTSNRTLIGSFCIALSKFLFGTIDALVKLSNLPESQLLTGRFVTPFIIAIMWWNCKKPPNSINWYGDKPDIMNIWMRGIIYTMDIIGIYYAIIRLPLADVSCIYAQAPILTAIMAWIFLKEQLPKLTPIICIFAVIGIMFISQPSFLVSIYCKYINQGIQIQDMEDTQPLTIDGLIATFIALFAWSLVSLLTRCAKDTHFLQLEIVSAGQTLFVAIPVILILNKYILHDTYIGDVDLSDWCFDIVSLFIMIIIGIIGFVALQLAVIGFQYGDATKVVWTEYLGIVFSCLYQIFLFDDPLNLFEIIGVILVIIACSLSILEEIYNTYFSKQYKHDVVQNIPTSDDSDSDSDSVAYI